MGETPLCLCTLLAAIFDEVTFADLIDFQPPVSVLGATVACGETFGGAAELKIRMTIFNLLKA